MTKDHFDINRLLRVMLLTCLAAGLCLFPAVSAYTYKSESNLTEGYVDLHIISNSVVGPTSLLFHPDSGDLDLYALECETSDGSCSCPSALDVIKDSTLGPGIFLMLLSGTWCVAVSDRSGSSEYILVCDFFGCEGQFINSTPILFPVT
jgi:hypothetical protein